MPSIDSVALIVNVRVLVDHNVDVSSWRISALGFVARVLGVPLRAEIIGRERSP